MARYAILALAGIAAVGVGHGVTSEDGQHGRSTVGAMIQGCNSKGNISINSGARIYHMPGQNRYAETIITPSKGERWFCSEDEARSAGWRRARS